MTKSSNNAESEIRSHFRNQKFHSYIELQKDFDTFWSEKIMPYCSVSLHEPGILKLFKSISPSVSSFVRIVKSPWYKRLIGIKDYAYLDLNGVVGLTNTWLATIDEIEKALVYKKTDPPSDDHNNKEFAEQRWRTLLKIIHVIYMDLYKINDVGRKESDILFVKQTVSDMGFEIIEYQPGTNEDLFTIEPVDYIHEQYLEVPTIIDINSNKVIFKGKVYSQVKK